MQSLTSDQIAHLSFDNSLVTEMKVSAAAKALSIRCDRAFLDHGDQSIEIKDVLLSVIGFDKLVARIYNDEEFVTVDATDEAFYLAEICEFTHEGQSTMLSGFSTQEGSWSDFTLEGGVFSIAHR